VAIILSILNCMFYTFSKCAFGVFWGQFAQIWPHWLYNSDKQSKQKPKSKKNFMWNQVFIHVAHHDRLLFLHNNVCNVCVSVILIHRLDSKATFLLLGETQFKDKFNFARSGCVRLWYASAFSGHLSNSSACLLASAVKNCDNLTTSAVSGRYFIPGRFRSVKFCAATADTTFHLRSQTFATAERNVPHQLNLRLEVILFP